MKLPTGYIEFGIVFFSIGDLELRIEDWLKINMGKAPIPNSNSPIGYLITFSSVMSDKGVCRRALAKPGLLNA